MISGLLEMLIKLLIRYSCSARFRKIYQVGLPWLNLYTNIFAFFNQFSSKEKIMHKKENYFQPYSHNGRQKGTEYNSS